MHTSLRNLTFLGLALTFTAPARAQCADWESQFDPSGAVGEVRAQIVFDDGSGPALYVGGAFQSIGTLATSGIAKWDGANWSALGTGIAGPIPRVLSLCVFDDGGGPALFVGGSFTSAGGTPANGIAKWDGSSWSALDGGLTDYSFNLPEARCLAVFDDGTGDALYVGGQFNFVDGAPLANFARWDGASWSNVGGTSFPNVGTNAPVHALQVFDDGAGARLFVGGEFSTFGGAPVPVLFAWNGASPSWISGPADQVRALAIHDDGTGDALYVGVWSNNKRVGKWDGVSWTLIATNQVAAQPVALQSFDDSVHGRRLCVGSVGNFANSFISTWDGSAWSQLGQPIGSVRTLGLYDDGGGEKLIIGGEFSSFAMSALAVSDGTSLMPFWNSTSVDAPVVALASFDDGGGAELVACGNFTHAADDPISNLASFDGASWNNAGVATWPYDTEHVNDLFAWNDGSGDALYISGNFRWIDGVEMIGIARRSGGAWSTVGAGLGYVYPTYVNALCSFDDGSGGALFAGGDYTLANGAPGNYVARWNGASWTGLDASFPTKPVLAMASFDSPTGPRLVVSDLNTATGAFDYIQAWDGSAWSSLGTEPKGNVYALAAFNDGNGEALYAGGTFTTAGGFVAPYIARWSGYQWSPLASGVNGAVYALEVFDDGFGPALFVGGTFTTAGGLPARNVARYDGSQWSALGAGVDGRVNAFTVHDDGSGPALYLGGEFRTSGSVAAEFIAKWARTCACSSTSYCTSGITSNGCVPTISGTGTPSASAGSGFTISIAGVEGQKQGHVFYGLSGPNAAPWGASSHFLCVKAPSQRTGTQDSGGTSGACDGVIALDWNTYIATHPNSLGAPFSAGTNVWAQLYFRDPAGPKTTALSNGLMFTVCP